MFLFKDHPIGFGLCGQVHPSPGHSVCSALIGQDLPEQDYFGSPVAVCHADPADSTEVCCARVCGQGGGGGLVCCNMPCRSCRLYRGVLCEGVWSGGGGGGGEGQKWGLVYRNMPCRFAEVDCCQGCGLTCYLPWDIGGC